MDTVLWIIQFLLAIIFLLTGVLKLIMPKEKAAERIGYVNDLSQNQLYAIGVLEIAAALGLVLPMALGILPVLTPLAAAGLVLTMIAAAGLHVRRQEWSMILVNLVLLAMAAYVVYGRLLAPVA
jgi:uncharacterized membrane protein YphA (DoxX/SURF4 family)